MDSQQTSLYTWNPCHPFRSNQNLPLSLSHWTDRDKGQLSCWLPSFCTTTYPPPCPRLRDETRGSSEAWPRFYALLDNCRLIIHRHAVFGCAAGWHFEKGCVILICSKNLNWTKKLIILQKQKLGQTSAFPPLNLLVSIDNSYWQYISVASRKFNFWSANPFFIQIAISNLRRKSIASRSISNINDPKCPYAFVLLLQNCLLQAN